MPKHKKVTENVDKWWRERREISQTIPKYLMSVATANTKSIIPAKTSLDFQAIYQRERLDSKALHIDPELASQSSQKPYFGHTSKVYQSAAGPKPRSEEKSAGQPQPSSFDQHNTNLYQVAPHDCQLCQAFLQISQS